MQRPGSDGEDKEVKKGRGWGGGGGGGSLVRGSVGCRLRCSIIDARSYDLPVLVCGFVFLGLTDGTTGMLAHLMGDREWGNPQ